MLPEIVWNSLLAVAGTAIVWISSIRLETASERIADYHAIPEVVKGAVITAVASSFPELSSVIIATLAHGEFELGVETIWMMLGWTLGDLCGWLFFYPRVRIQSEELDVNTMTGLLAKSRDRILRPLMVVGGVITFVFLGVYASAQLKAGSTALHALFGWDMWIGALIATGIVIIYSFAGGIRADIWTDAAQSAVMIVAMFGLVVAGWIEVGGPASLLAELRNQDPSLVS